MTKEILNILDNILYWETCPDDYKETIKKYLVSEKKKQALNKHIVINWVACSERLPKGAMGSYLACLENNTVHKLQYSDITKHWWDIAMGGIRPNNPVKYWAEIPEPPCL